MTPMHDELVARATALIPALKERAPEAERLRQMPAETLKDARAIGLARVLRPEVYGGYDDDYRTFAHIVRELARGCASTGWCASTWMSQSMTLARYPKEAQDEVCLADPDAFVGTTGVPGGRATPVQGGWMLSGQWSFASGVHATTYISAGGVTAEGLVRGFLIPTREVEILDTWNPVGLRGTGSTDYVAREVFIPAHRSIEGANWVWRGASEPFVTGPTRNHGAGTTQVTTSIFAPAAVGNALAFIDAFVAMAPARTFTYARIKQADHVGTQQRLAETAVEVDVAAMLLERCYDELDRYASDGRIPTDTRSRMRRDTAYAVNLCYHAIDRLFEVSGAHALDSSGELQRRWRDAHAIASQPNFHWDFEAETWGRIKLGLEPKHPSL
ncbi:MAG: acyl-CoA dehydrogenase family protein [bacterium]